MVKFLLAAGAVGDLYMEQASISGAEVDLPGEVGSAASMAAGMAEVMGSTPEQVENAAKMAAWGDGHNHVTLDEVIVTMRETGRNMSSTYKETSMGWLAVNVVER